jgi:hypothetical protein
MLWAEIGRDLEAGALQVEDVGISAEYRLFEDGVCDDISNG